MKAAIVLSLLLAAAPAFADGFMCNSTDIKGMQSALNHPENFMTGLPKVPGADLRRALADRDFEYCHAMLREPEGFSVYSVKVDGRVYLIKLFFNLDHKLSGAYLDSHGVQPPVEP